ncbi:WD repeat-containing protein 87-like [Dasypus novemcinctus]|uniref:WD repeat-containing protein 87-like n=1 Tax=Dasypus novemcinctus TaxID=9361 RepID=UPI0039C91A72
MQVVLWIQKKDEEMKGIIEKMEFPMVDQLPPIRAMVHTGSYHMLIAYCGELCLRLFADHHRAFTSLGTVSCRFSISCLCYDSETEMLLSGTSGAVVTWFILPNGKGLQMAQTVPMPGHELVQGFSLNGPQGSLLALCENKVRAFTHQGQGQLEEVKSFIPIASGSSITCSFTCFSQGYLYAGSRAGEIHAWGLDQGNFLHSFQAHSSSVVCVHSRPEIHTLLTAGSEGLVREWNLTSGNLLRQLDIDEDLRKLQFIDNTTFFCQTAYAFSLHHMPYFYSLFNVCGSTPQQVQRVCCGHNWTRILCATEDGLLHFLSPVTGNLLVITWPLLVMDKAIAWAYDSDREEIFVAIGGSDVLVFDATRSPCTVKYLVRTSVKYGDTVRCLAYGRSHLVKGLQGLMFCGYQSGIVRILSHYSWARLEKTVHSGEVLALSTLEGPQENSLLCSYGMDNFVHVTEAVLQANKVILQPLSKILSSCPLKYVILLPGSVGAITENDCWRLWHYQDLQTSSESKESSTFRETKRLHQFAITSFDVCLSLKLFVTGAIDGTVRIWDFHGRLITELDSALHFGPLCFANNRGDLLLTFNQSLYLVSCLKLFPPALLIHLITLNNADEIQEVPKPFLPSFFFSFEIVLVPKFVYLGQGLQELQGLESLVNKRAIAFDNIVPHVVEEEGGSPLGIQEGSQLQFVKDKNIGMSVLDPKHDRPLHMVPAQLRLAGWDGLNPYHILRHFFGQGQQWPFAPDGYIPNSVIRARLWPEGTPIFLHCGLHPLCQDKDWDLAELLRSKELLPMNVVEEKISVSTKVDKSRERRGTSFDILMGTTNQNWMERKFSEGLLDNLIEAILNLTICCSVEKYKKYFSVLAQIFATYQVSPRLRSEAARHLLDDTTHSNPCIRALAWEGLFRLGLMSRLFAIPLTVGLMDSDEYVRTKVLYLMTRVTGIQTKTMLVHLLQKQETLQEMQQELVGEVSLDLLLGIRATDIRLLLAHVNQQLNENLTLSYKDQLLTPSFGASRTVKLETLAEQTLIPFTESEKTTKLKKSKQHFQAKSKKLIKRDLRVARKHREKEFGTFSTVVVPSEKEGEQVEARELGQIDAKDVALEAELPLTTFSPFQSQDSAESKEVTLEGTEALGDTVAMEVTEVMKATDQHDKKDDGKVISQLEKRANIKKLWKRAVQRTLSKAAVKRAEKIGLQDISEVSTEEPKEEVIPISEQKEVTKKKVKKSGRGLAGTPGYKSRVDITSWRDDICSLVTSRIASSHPGMLQDLGKELVELAQVMLADRQPSWDLFQEICPLLKDSRAFSSELDERVVKEPPIIKEVGKGAVEEEGTVELRNQEDTKTLKKSRAFSKVKKKKVAFLKDHLVLQKNKFKKEVGKLSKQEDNVAQEERKLTKPEEESLKEKEKPIKDKKKMFWEEEILAFSQKKLTKKEPKVALEDKTLTGEEQKLLEEGRKVIWKKGERALRRKKLSSAKRMLAQEEGMWAKEEDLPVWKERKLAQKAEELDEEEEELVREKEELVEKEEELAWEEEELAWGEEELAWGEEELAWEEEGLAWEEEEPAWEEEEPAWEEEEPAWKEEEPAWEEEESAKEQDDLILDIEKHVREEKKQSLTREKHTQDREKHIEEKEKQAWKRGKLAPEEEHLSTEEEELFGEVVKEVLERESFADQENKLTSEKMKWYREKEKQTHKKKTQIHEKKKQVGEQDEQETPDQEERQAQKEEKETEENRQAAQERQKLDLEGKKQVGEMEKWSWKEENWAGEEKRQAWEEKRRAREERRQAQKEERQAQKGKRWARKIKKETEEKTPLAPEEEKKMEEVKKSSQKEEKRAMEKEKQTKKEEKWIRKDKKATEEKLARQPETQAQKERLWGQKEKKLSWKKATKAGPIKQGKLSLERQERAGEMEKQFKEKETGTLEKRLTQKDSRLAKERRSTAKNKKAIAKEGIATTKRRQKILKEEKGIMEGKDKLSQEEGKLFYDIRTKEKITKKEQIQATKKTDMEKGISSEEKESSSMEKKLGMKEKQLLRILGKIIREMNNVPLEEVEITEEEKELVHKGRTLTAEESLEEDRKLLGKVQEKPLLDKTQVENVLKEVQEQYLLEKRQLEEFLKRIDENESEKIQVKWLIENMRNILYENLTEKDIEESPTKKGKEEENLIEEEQEILPKMEKRKHLFQKRKKEVSLGEENLEKLGKKHKKKSLTQKRKKEEMLTKEKERLTKEKKEGPCEEEKEELHEEKELLNEEESLSEESLSEEEEESVSEEESLSEEKESLSEEEESLSEEEESLSEEKENVSEEESLSEEESESEEEEESLSKEASEEESLSKEEKEKEELEKYVKEDDKKEEREKDAERVFQTEFSKERVSFFKVMIEGEDLAEERERTAKRKMPFKKDRVQSISKPMDEAMWSSFLKIPFKIPLQEAMREKGEMLLKVLGDRLDLEEGQDSQILGVHPKTSSWGRQGNVLLQKARDMFLQAMETGLETQIPESLHKPKSRLSDIIIEPQKPEHRPTSGWKWFTRCHRDFPVGKSEHQISTPTPTLAFSPEMPANRYQRPRYSEASLSDEDWINNALIRLEAGEQLSRDSFHKLSQFLKDFSSKGYLEWMRLANLKAIAKHHRQELSHTNTSQLFEDVLSPVHLEVIPPVRRKEKESWLKPFPVPEPVLPSVTKRIPASQTLSLHLLAESYRKKEAQQVSRAVKEIKHLYPIRKYVPIALYSSLDKKPLALKFQKDFQDFQGQDELPKFPKVKKKALPILEPVLPSAIKGIQVPKAVNWHILGKPYRSERAQQLSNARKEMAIHFYPATRDVFTGVHASVDKQTLALMFQKDFWAFKGKNKFPKLPKVEKKAQTIPKKRDVPQWETFVALYHVLRMLQQRYAKDHTTWMEQFYQLMDLYQLKSPQIQRLLLDLLEREEPQPQDIIYKKALKTKELVLGERLFCGLFCGVSQAPGGLLEFRNVLPLPGQNNVHTLQPVGIAQYGFLELAWKSLPQVDSYLIERLPNIPTPTLWPDY